MFRKGVSALIINGKKEFLLVNLESFAPRYFAIPGGGVDGGETLEEAVYREVHEELGISRDSLEIVGKSDTPLRFKFKVIKLSRGGREYLGSERYFFGFRFLGTTDQIIPQKGEVRSYKWVPVNQLPEHLLFDNQYKETMEKVREIFPRERDYPEN